MLLLRKGLPRVSLVQFDIFRLKSHWRCIEFVDSEDLLLGLCMDADWFDCFCLHGVAY